MGRNKSGQGGIFKDGDILEKEPRLSDIELALIIRLRGLTFAVADVISAAPGSSGLLALAIGIHE
jgi:hypothetical protein